MLDALTVLRRTDYSVHVTGTYSGTGTHNATTWQIWQGGILKYDSGWDLINLINRWITGLPTNMEFQVRAKTRNSSMVESAWTDFVTFRTRRIFIIANAAGGAAASFNQDRNEGTNHTIAATYGQLIHGIGFTLTYPDLLPVEEESAKNVRGMRSRWHNFSGNYIQPEGPSAVNNVVRYGGAAMDQTNGDCSCLFAFRPEYADVIGGDSYDPSGKSLLFGSQFWWFFRNMGNVQIRATSDDLTAGSEPFLSVPGLVNRGHNLLIVAYRRERVNNACMLATTGGTERITVPGICRMWLNNNVVEIGTLYGGLATFPMQSVPGCPEGFSAVNTIGIGFNRGAAPHNYIYLGTQSSDGARGIYDSNYYSYAGMISHFAWWPNRLLTNAEVAGLRTAYADDDPEALPDTVKALSPALYDRLMQPQPPRRPVGMAAVS